MKRVLTLIGAIIGIVCSALFVTLSTISILVLNSFLDTPSAALIILEILTVCVGVTTLVLDVFALRCFSCPPEKYAKRRNLLIAATVFTLAPSAAISFFVFGNFFEFYLIAPIVLLAIISAALFVIDIILEKRRIENAPPATTPTEPSATTEQFVREK